MFKHTYQLAGISFAIEADIPLVVFPAGYFEEFAVETAQPDIVCCLRGLSPAEFTADPLDDAGRAHLAAQAHVPTPYLRHPLLSTPEVRAVLDRTWDHLRDVTMVFDALSLTICDFHRRTLNIFYVYDPAHSMVDRHIGNGLFTPFLPLFSAAMFHSSSVSRGDLTAVFFAPDGGGKTTSATLAPDGTILCDDQNIVRREEGHLRVYGTPWGRHVSSQQRGQLGGLFLLEKAERFELCPVTPSDALHTLWQEHRGYYEFVPPGLRLQVIDFLLQFCYEVPVYRLRFPKHYIDWDAVDAVMAARRDTNNRTAHFDALAVSSHP